MARENPKHRSNARNQHYHGHSGERGTGYESEHKTDGEKAESGVVFTNPAKDGFPAHHLHRRHVEVHVKEHHLKHHKKEKK